MKKKCENCGFICDMILSEEKGSYNSLFGSVCYHCGAIIEPLDELPIVKINKEKLNMLREKCLRQVFGSRGE
ncbi:MAG: hypothetical protein ACOC5T_00845 [Elusimicrobiota bacterium]